MSRKAYLLAVVLAGVGAVALWSEPALVQGGPAGTGTLSRQEAEEDVLRLTPPGPAIEHADFVPHATLEEATAIAEDFFARPAPTDAELAAIAPFIGTKNVQVQRCDVYEPKAAKDELTLAPASPDRRMKGEIYDRLNVMQVLRTGDCTCIGKVAAYEPVGIILTALKKQNGEPDGRLFTPYRTETLRLLRTVERLCQGEF